MGKNVYHYDGHVFTSLKQLSNYAGINEKTLTARLRRGMSLDDACTKKDLHCSYREFNGEEKSLIDICRDENKDPELVRNRLRYGYTLDEALNRRKKISRQGKPIIIKGVLYNSISEALRRLNLTDKEGVVRSRLQLGWSPDRAFDFGLHKGCE